MVLGDFGGVGRELGGTWVGLTVVLGKVTLQSQPQGA